MDVRSFVRALPKAELHLHLEGALEPETMMRLAARNRVEVPFRSVEEIRAAYRFTRLQDFLDIYYRGMDVLRVEEDFYELTTAYLERAAADGAVHVEVFFDPQGHTARGIPFETAADGILAALADGRERFGITSLLIMCVLRHLSEDDGFEPFSQAEPYIADRRIAGLGLDGRRPRTRQSAREVRTPLRGRGARSRSTPTFDETSLGPARRTPMRNTLSTGASMIGIPSSPTRAPSRRLRLGR